MKKIQILMLVCIAAATNAKAALDTTTIFYDAFSGTIMSSANWHFYTSSAASYLPITQFRVTPDSPLSSVISDNAIIRFDTYNPTGPNSFFGTDVITNRTFTPGPYGLIITVCAAIQTPPVVPGGIIAGIFLYNAPVTSGGDHDEIDFEIYTESPTLIHTNIYPDIPLGFGTPDSSTFTPSSVITDVHTYVIYWLPDSVVWFVDGIRVRSAPDAITNAMNFQLNIWAPDSNSTLIPDHSYATNQDYQMHVCEVRVDSLLAPPTIAPNIGKQNLETKFYPNPASDVIHFTAAVKNVIVYTVTGEAVLAEPEITNTGLSVAGLSPGLYFIEYEDASNIVNHDKLIIY